MERKIPANSHAMELLQNKNRESKTKFSSLTFSY